MYFRDYENHKEEVAIAIEGILTSDNDSDTVKIKLFDDNVVVQFNPITADSVYEWTLFNGTVGDLRSAVEKFGLNEYVRMLLV